MSLKSFFKKIANAVARFFKGLVPELKKAVHIGVTVTDSIKNFDTSNPVVADLITSLIPGDIDDAVKKAIRSKLPDIVKQLKLVDATLQLTDPDEIVAAAIKTLQQLSGDYRSSFLNSLSIIIARVAADGKLSWDDAAYLLKWYYDHKDVPEVDTTI